MFVLILFSYVLIFLIEVLPLNKQKNKKEIIIYISMMSISLTISLLLSFGIKIESPAWPIKNLVLTIIGKK